MRIQSNNEYLYEDSKHNGPAMEIDGEKLVAYRGSLKEVVIPDVVKVIGDGAFRNLQGKNIKSIKLPRNLTEI